MSRYMGWDREEMRAMGGSRADTGDVGSEPQPKKRKTVPGSQQPPGFTPINRPRPLPRTDTPSATDDAATAHKVSESERTRASRDERVLRMQEAMLDTAAMIDRAQLPHKPTPKQSKPTSIAGKRSGKESTSKVGTGLKRAVSDGMRQSKPKVAASRKSQNAPDTDSIEQDQTIPQAISNPASDCFVISEKTRSKLDAFRHQPQSSRAESDSMPIISPVTSLDMLATQQGERSDGWSSQPSSAASLHSASWDEAQSRNTKRDELDVDDDDGRSQHHANSFPAPQHKKRRITASRKSQLMKGHLSQNPGLQTIHEESERNSQDEQPQQSSLTHGNEVDIRSPSPIFSPFNLFNTARGEHATDDDDGFSDGLNEEDFLSVPIAACGRYQLPTPLTSNAGSSFTAPASNDQQTNPVGDGTKNRAFLDDDCVVIENRDEIACIDLREVNDSAKSNPKNSMNARQLQRTRLVRPLKNSPALNLPDTSLTATGGTDIKPFVRPPFPNSVRDRSPIIGLTPDPSLRVCFRVGEALNEGSKAVRENRTVFIELYARVRSSSRDGVRQSFVFQDLYHDHPPYLNAVYEIWKGIPLWEYDSGRFLHPTDTPKMCRCIGKMKREGTAWKLVILNIWEAGCDDIDTVKGIIAA